MGLTDRLMDKDYYALTSVGPHTGHHYKMMAGVCLLRDSI